jgi:sugar phosphate isomerase/epimerase
MKDFRYSVNTNTFRKSKTSAEIIDLCVKAGADGIEWGLKTLENAPADVREMKKLTADAGLEIVGFLNAGSMWKKDLMRQWSEALADCDGKTLRVEYPWFAWDYTESLHQPDSYLDLVKRAKDSLPMLEALAREYRIKYVLEMHSGSIAADPWAIRYLMEGIDPDCVGAIYDPANTVIEGFIRPRGTCEILGRHLAYVHAKNVEIFFALKCCGFRGWLSLEEFVAENYVQEISESIRFLSECAEAAPDAPCEPFSNFNN